MVDQTVPPVEFRLTVSSTPELLRTAAERAQYCFEHAETCARAAQDHVDGNRPELALRFLEYVRTWRRMGEFWTTFPACVRDTDVSAEPLAQDCQETSHRV
jgi:hypothetical protein